MNKVIVPTGYMGSGSSIVTDFVSEFDNVRAPHGDYDFEYVFMHCPDGVFDLEDKLLVGNNAMRSDEALRSFLAAMRELSDTPFWWAGEYRRRLGPHFMEATRRFVDSLVEYRSGNNWYVQERRGWSSVPLKVANRAVKAASGGRLGSPTPLKYKGMLFSFPTPKEFYAKARAYLGELFGHMGLGEANLLMDQLLLPHNAWRMDSYFPEGAECFIVERDPRDVFLLNKYVLSKKYGAWTPYPTDVGVFCGYYRRLRQTERPITSSHVHRVHFENMVYKYDEETARIADILGFGPSEWTGAGTRLDPTSSINNTQLFRIPAFAPEAEIIAHELPEYIYHFPFEFEPAVKEMF